MGRELGDVSSQPQNYSPCVRGSERGAEIGRSGGSALPREGWSDDESLSKFLGGGSPLDASFLGGERAGGGEKHIVESDEGRVLILTELPRARYSPAWWNVSKGGGMNLCGGLRLLEGKVRQSVLRTGCACLPLSSSRERRLIPRPRLNFQAFPGQFKGGGGGGGGMFGGQAFVFEKREGNFRVKSRACLGERSG